MQGKLALPQPLAENPTEDGQPSTQDDEQHQSNDHDPLFDDPDASDGQGTAPPGSHHQLTDQQEATQDASRMYQQAPNTNASGQPEGFHSPRYGFIPVFFIPYTGTANATSLLIDFNARGTAGSLEDIFRFFGSGGPTNTGHGQATARARHSRGRGNHRNLQGYYGRDTASECERLNGT